MNRTIRRSWLRSFNRAETRPDKSRRTTTPHPDRKSKRRAAAKAARTSRKANR